MLQRSVCLFAVAAAVLLAPPVFAQGGGGRSDILGTVFDQDKGVLPGATVTATNEATGQVRTAVTGGDGRFTIPTLVPGMYTVKVELQGFQTMTQTGLVVNVGQEVTLNLTLQLAGVAEAVTVTGETPIVEVTSSRIGTNVTSAEIDGLPSGNRSQFAIMQTIPGLVPSLQPGSFEGGQFNANGQATSANLFLVDGQYDNDSRLGGAQGTQARVTLDTMAEYQVQTHQYGAEYGGSTGVVVNSVTRSGTNRLAGRVFDYFQDNKLTATDYFLKQAGEKNPEGTGSNVFGGSLGGPIIRNKLFFFGNFEYDRQHEAANLNFPADAAPLARSYSTTTDFTGPNHFLKFDHQLNGSNQLSFRWLREAILTQRDSIENDKSLLDNARHENDAGDIVYSFSWMSVLNSRTTNEVKLGHVRESLLQGPKSLFDDNWKFIGFRGIEPFDVGSQNTHPDYVAGPRNTYGQNLIRDITFDDTFTWIKSGWGGEHSFKTGFAFSRNGALPQGTAANFIGLFDFPTNKPFNAADPTSYPYRFRLSMGQFEFRVIDRRASGYVSDKWAISKQLTLNLGLRYDWQKAVPKTKDALGPRIGAAYDVTGNGKTLLRGGVGKVYQYQPTAILLTLAQRALVAPTLAYDTGEVTSPAITGVLPVGGDVNATACLRPVPGPVAGEAVMSAACRAFLGGTRASVLAGGFINNPTLGPIVDGDRRMAYTWAFSAGVKRELANNMAVSVDYVGNRGRDNTAIIDVNEGPINPATGRVTRLGVNVFDPNGALIPLSNTAARNTTFVQFNQEQTLSALDSDFNSLELEFEKRYSNRWSGRVSYTLARCRDVGGLLTSNATAGVTVDSNPRLDYGACDRDNRHAFASSASVDVWRGLGASMVFRTYSGNPINERTGVDTNRDGTNNDRPTQGVDDRTVPIRSKVDSRGVAVRNGVDGENKVILDGRFQYIWRIQRYQAGVFLEIYNLTDHVNFGNPNGARNSRQFLIPIVTDYPRTAQLGFRLIF
jgi:hypothetical protein